jgi:aminomethyltransferase
MNSISEGLRTEYQAIREGAGVIDFSTAGKLQISGKNAVQFLNGLVSNEVKTLEAGEGALAAFPTLQGKLAALCRMYNTGTYLLLELDAINREKIYKNLARFVPAGEFFVTDMSEQFALYSVQGPKAPALIESLTDQPFPFSDQRKISERKISYRQVRIASHSRSGLPGYDIFVTAEYGPKLLETILARGGAQGARLASPEAFEIVRIEAGVPREGVDAGEDYIILESELEAAVSYTKGCYLGQEVIARIHWRGQPAKRLRGLLIDADEIPAKGAELWSEEEKKIGEITSSTFSPSLDRIIALGYVHRHYLTPGMKFRLGSGGSAELVETPFIK